MSRTIILSILVCLILTLNSSAEIITLVDVQDSSNWGDYFLPPGVDPLSGSPPGWSEYYRFEDENWGWTHTFNFEGPVEEILFLRLEIDAWDVDTYDQEIHLLYGDDIFLGYLIPPPGQPYGANAAGYNAVWYVTDIPLRPEALEALMDGQMDMWIDINGGAPVVPGDAWAVTLGSSTLTLVYTDTPLTEPYTPPEEPYIPTYEPSPYEEPGDSESPTDSGSSEEPDEDPSEEPYEDPSEEPDNPSENSNIPPDDIYISPDDPNIKIYVLSPIDVSSPRINNTGDGIDCIGIRQAWLAFDLSCIPDNDQVISATLSAYLIDFNGEPSQRTLWYDSDDSWVYNSDRATSDPGDSEPADIIVGTIVHDDTSYTWRTIDITHDWSNDLIDEYITFMISGPENHAYESGAIGLGVDHDFYIESGPKLTLMVYSDSEIDKTYDDLFNLGAEEIVQADGYDINVGTYSVPSVADWNDDGLSDLIIGTGSGKVLVYINIGTKSEPIFSDSFSFYAQSNGSDLYCPPSGCMGCFPRVVYWNADKYKDLLVGQSDGTIRIFLNINDDEEPEFDGGTYLTVGQGAYETIIDVGNRATPTVVDWNNDGRKDLVSGAYDGKIHIFINEGTDTEPVFLYETFAIEDGSALQVPGDRSSPEVFDLDFDGKKDILTGNTEGQLLLYINVGTDEAPLFSGYELVDSDGTAIDLFSTPRSRPSVCYWNEDGYPDVLIGSQDGNVHLYLCKTIPADLDLDGDIDFADWTFFAAYWGQKDCGQCGGADLNNDGKVDADDISWIADNWLLSIK